MDMDCPAVFPRENLTPLDSNGIHWDQDAEVKTSLCSLYHHSRKLIFKRSFTARLFDPPALIGAAITARQDEDLVVASIILD